MEQKCLKTGVFVNETIYLDTAEQAVDIDFTLPDYCPDISKIFKCQAMPRIAAKGITDKPLNIEGLKNAQVLIFVVKFVMNILTAERLQEERWIFTAQYLLI